MNKLQKLLADEKELRKIIGQTMLETIPDGSYVTWRHNKHVQTGVVCQRNAFSRRLFVRNIKTLVTRWIRLEDIDLIAMENLEGDNESQH